MKKMAIIALAAIMVIAFAMPVMAESSISNMTDVVSLGTGTNGNWLTYGVSNNVHVSYTTMNSYQDFGVATTHKSGNRSYATTNNTTLIYYTTKSTGVTTVAAPTATATSVGGWTAL